MERPIHILVAEDSAGDRRLISEAFAASKRRTQVYLVENGSDALAFLNRQSPYVDAPKPDLILLDLNLPKVDGLAVLRAIKDDLKLQRIPVVIFSTSQNQEEIRQCYDLHASCFITKPAELGEFFSVIQTIAHFWTIAELCEGD